MKKKTWVVMILALFAMGLFLVSCDKPTEELERAESALAAARDAGAPELAADQYQSAEDKLNEGKELMDSRKYSQAREALIEAEQLAGMARQAALEAKGEEVEAVVTAPVEVEEPEPRVVERPTLPTKHVVVKGECLWMLHLMR
jgi:hypothetical protein